MRWWLLLALAACGDNDAADVTRSGSRLAVQWYQADDGTRVPTGTIHDRELDSDCWSHTFTDGTRRCVADDGFVAYSDAQCTQPLIVGWFATGGIAGDWNDQACAETHAYRTGAALGMGPYYWKSGAACATQTSPANLFAVGPELPAETLPLLERVETGGERLHAVHLASPDGFSVPLETFDSELATSCLPGDRECEPYSESGGHYVDAACTHKVAAVYTACGNAAKYFEEPDTCGTSQRVYRLGAAVAVTNLYKLDSGACVADMVDASAEYHTIGEEVSPAQMSMRMADAPGRRLQEIYYAGSGAAATAGLYDTELATRCSWQMARDRVVRCLPPYYSFQSYFRDPTCTTLVQATYVSKPMAGCAPYPAPAFVNDGGGGVHEVGAKLDKLYSTSGSGCIAAPDADYYLVGGEIDPASFVSATTTYD